MELPDFSKNEQFIKLKRDMGIRSHPIPEHIVEYDYENQAWVENGKYVDCGHPPIGTVLGPHSPAPGTKFRGCNCYGRRHAGERVTL